MVSALMDNLDQNLAARDLGIFNWQWDLRARQVNLASEELLRGRLEADYASQTGTVYGALNQLLQMIVPENQDKKFAKAISYAKTDDRINGIIETQIDFGMSGFTAASDSKESVEKIKTWNREHHIFNILLEMWSVGAACDNVVVMLQKKSAALTILPLPNLKIVPIHTTDNKGKKQFRTFLKVPEEFAQYVRKNKQRHGDKASEKALKGIPEKWINAVMHPHVIPDRDPIHPSGGYLELKAEEDEHIFIINRKGIEDRLVDPSMATVFPSIKLRRFLQDGEFSIAYMIKYFIHQVKVGPTAEAQNLARALRAGKINKGDREEIKNLYRGKIDKVLFEVTDQFLEHVFHFPGSEVDFGKRYATPDERIDWWARISRQIMVGDRGSYSGGLIYLKGYSRKISRFRTLFAQFLQDLYAEILKDKGAEIQWDEHYMKEPRQKLREMQLTSQRGMDMETFCRIMGYNWKQWVADREKTVDPEILKMKGSEKEYLYWQEIQKPFFEPNQGMLVEGSSGRPATTEEQTDDSLREPEPRPESFEGADLGQG